MADTATPVVPSVDAYQDPTALTTQQILREVAHLQEILETRMDAYDKAITLLQKFADSKPGTSDVQHEVLALREVVFEKFKAIEDQFQQLSVQTEKNSKDVKSAVDAAFAAAKEAVGEQNKSNALSIEKSEKAFTKQIDGLTDLTKSNTKNTDDKINDIKESITRIDSVKKGGDATWAIVGSLIFLALAVLGSVITLAK